MGCHMASRYPDVVKLLIADRTLDSLSKVAGISFGQWAVQGLKLAGLYAENVPAFLNAKCTKVIINDPRDGIIADLASLKSGVASQIVAHSNSADLSAYGQFRDEDIQRFASNWAFLEWLLETCEVQLQMDMDGDTEPEPSGLEKLKENKSRCFLCKIVQKKFLTSNFHCCFYSKF